MNMRHIAIIGGTGSTGSTGKEVIRQALGANHRVTSVERNPKPNTTENLKVVKGDVTDLDSLVEAFKDADVVISCFGPTNHRKVGNLMSVGTSNIVKACKKNGVKRFVFMSGFVQTGPNELSLLYNLTIRLFRLYFHQSYNDKVIAEASIQNSTLDWVIARAAGLSHSQPTGKYKAGVKTRIPFAPMSYADCAKCLLDAVDEKSWTRQIINVGKS